MSDITMKNLEDAQAFFDKLEEDEMRQTLFSISLSFNETINHLDDLHEYEERKLVKLINTQVNFNTLRETIKDTIQELETKGSKA